MSDDTYYRNDQTGIIQRHPVSGLGAFLNSTEVGPDAKPLVPLGASTDETKRRTKLAKGDADEKTPEATTGTGSANKKQESDQ